MLFFQATLFLGYLLADQLNRWISVQYHLWFYLSLFLVAAWSLPILPTDAWKPMSPDQPGWKVLVLLLICVGLPYLILATTGPMTQAWLARVSQHSRVYRLYALSNAGSLLALLAYPFLIEPNWKLRTQAVVWSGMFVVYCIGMYVCAKIVRDHFRHQPNELRSKVSAADNAGGTTDEQLPNWCASILWVVLPMFASISLLATTNYVCQDIASIPLLWIVPLALYLLSFILCFDRPVWYRPVLMSLGAIACVALSANTESFSPLATLYRLLGWQQPELPESLAWLWHREVHFSTKFVFIFVGLLLACMVLHGETYRLRPSPKYLTYYYLSLAGGGALGGVFVNLIAPLIFSQYYEWGISLGVIACISLIVLIREAWNTFRRPTWKWQRWAVVVAGVMLLPFLIHAVYLVGKQATKKLSSDTIFAERNFYGAFRVSEMYRENPDYHVRTLVHGIIKHGEQYPSSELRYFAGSYYAPGSGVALAMEALQGKPKRVGVVGLGAGSLAAYAMKGDTFTFYELNPRIEYVADKFFTYVGDAKERGATIEIVSGDARLSMERQPSQQFDALVIDAFSGDSIPVHLLTKEAMDVYAKHLKPDGLLIFHVSNSYLNLVPVTCRLSEYAGMTPIHIKHRSDASLGSYTTDYVILTNRESFLSSLPKYLPDANNQVPLWTDESSNLLQILKL